MLNKKETPKVIVLGSAAAEGVPAFFCECPTCRNARKIGGREIRKRTSYNFGGKLQIDYGPDIMQAFQAYEEVNRTRHVLITHAHEDHFALSEVYFKAQGFSQTPPDDVLTFYGSAVSYDRLMAFYHSVIGQDVDREKLASFGVAFKEIRAFEPFDIPEIGAHVIPLHASHEQRLNPMIYIVTIDGRSVLFGNDTGLFPDDTVRYLSSMTPVPLDVAILDDTGCLNMHSSSWTSHLGAAGDLEMFALLAKLGYVTDSTIKVVNHFSHNQQASHIQLENFWLPKGIAVGYDGMEL